MINANTLPTLTDRKFGVEIEYVGAHRDEVVQAINSQTNQECHFEGYTHRTTPHWKVVTDSSLHHSSGYTGELVSPILQGVEGVQALFDVLEALNSIEGVTVNRSCGLHVHLDAADLTVEEIRKVYERYADYESQIDAVMPRSRRGYGAQYVRTIKDNKARAKRARAKRTLSNVASKYHKVNLCNILTIGTVEFRQHSGTTDFNKIVHWISFLQQFVKVSKRMAISSPQVNKNRPYNNFRTVMENLGKPMTWSGGRWHIQGTWRTFANWQLDDCYDGNRDRDINLDLVSDLLIRTRICSESEVEQLSIVPQQEVEAARTTTIEDTGWLVGVDQQVQQYMAERELELN